ncbi:MAG: aspartate aminotransferase family protein [Verrucomicrobia bacterium]|nr:aspartate aminotransferase family protein [Verrucomicrobiota bacterium]
MPQFDITPIAVPKVSTRFRRIRTKLPVPQSVPVLEEMRRFEPQSMQGMPPVVWKRGDGALVQDWWGNQWIDWSSGVLVTNAGHGRKPIVDAVVKQAKSGLLHNYLFPHKLRGRLARMLTERAPKGMDKCFLLSTGSEAVECAIKLCRTRGRQADPKKLIMVSFARGFHGRTLGAQQAGGIPGLKSWIGNLDPGFVQVEFPDGFRCKDTSFEFFEKQLASAGVDPRFVCGVILESYQGGGASFAPVDYMQKLRAWCDKHGALLVCDEVQAGFGRTGKYWAFQHYDVRPDLICCGKGISSSLPVACLLGNGGVLDMYPPGSMTSTHSANPICCAAAIANLQLIDRERLVQNAKKIGDRLFAGLAKLQQAHPARIATVHGKGLVAGVQCVKPGGEEPDGDLAFRVVDLCYKKGLLMFAPVGFGGATVKIAPPLVISAAQLDESLAVLAEAFAEAAR